MWVSAQLWEVLQFKNSIENLSSLYTGSKPSFHKHARAPKSNIWFLYDLQKDPKTFLREILHAFWYSNKNKVSPKGAESKVWKSGFRPDLALKWPTVPDHLRLEISQDGAHLVLKPRKCQPNQGLAGAHCGWWWLNHNPLGAKSCKHLDRMKDAERGKIKPEASRAFSCHLLQPYEIFIPGLIGMYIAYRKCTLR